MILFKLDGELSLLAKRSRCSYSRYADDITFSFTHNRKHLPSQIVSTNQDREVHIGKRLSDIVEGNGFQINHAKTRLQHKTQHQGVTGLTVNEKTNINRKFIRKTSSMINALLIYGDVKSEFEHFSKYHQGYLPERQTIRMKNQPGDLFIKKIKGRINYIRMIRGASCNVYRKLMYHFTVALGKPNEDYARDWLAVIANSTFVIDTCVDANIFQGSGFLLKDIGIITNHHVVEGIDKHNIHNIEIYNWGNSSSPLKLIAFGKSDRKIDLAIIDPGVHKNTYQELEINENPDYSTGASVYAIGYPNHKEGEEPTIIRDAKILGKTTFLKQNRIKINKNIQHGFSGGVVLDSDGRVIGVMANGNAVGSKTTNDSSFIPIETLLTFVSEK